MNRRDEYVLRDAGVVIPAHDYSDELPPPRPTFEPIRGGWREVGEVLAGMVILMALFLGIPFLLFLLGAGA